MRRHIIIAALALLVLVAGMVWLLGGTSKGGALTSASQMTGSTRQGQAPASYQGASVTGGQSAASAPVQDPALDTAAVLSLREGRVAGDSRAPPMSVPTDERSAQPTQDQLDDPAAYAQYEKGEQLKVYQSYVNAVPQKVQTLQDALDKAAEPGSGVSQAQMDAARHKIELLKAMQAKLLGENPELVAPGSKTTATSSAATPATTNAPATSPSP